MFMLTQAISCDMFSDSYTNRLCCSSYNLKICMQEMAAGAERLFGIWGSFQPVLVPTVPALVRCPCPHLLISPAGGCTCTCFQQGAAVTVSKFFVS